MAICTHPYVFSTPKGVESYPNLSVRTLTVLQRPIVRPIPSSRDPVGGRSR